MNIKTIITIAIGIIIGITFTKLFSKSSKLQAPTNPTTLQKQTTKTESHSLQKINELNTNSQTLSTKITSGKSALALAKNKTLATQTQLQTLLSTKTADTTKTDNQIILTQLIKENNSKDSLYENIDSIRVRQLHNKIAVIAIKDSLYQSLKQCFTQSITQQELLYNQNQQLQKHFKRQKLKSKILSFSLLILSATAANYLLKQ